MNQVKRYIGLLGGLLACAAFSSVRADAFADYAQATEHFNRLEAQLAAQHRMPRQSDPESKAVLATLSDYRHFLEQQPFADEDLSKVMTMCGAAHGAAMSYALFDLKSHLDKSKTDPAEVARMTGTVASRNIVTYQDEFAPLLVFAVRCLAKQMPLVGNFVARLPPEEMTDVRRAGLAQMRRGVSTVYLSIAQIAMETVVSLRNRRAMFDAMLEASPAFASALDTETRTQIAAQMTARAGVVPKELRKDYQQILQALESAPCEVLCKL